MKMQSLRFRQVHLDFHTSEHIENIGADFDPNEFADTLKAANVDSITCFSKCHHGWSYHQTNVGKPHPHLKCELLPLQIEACHKVGIKVPAYISVGFDELSARQNPQWCVMDQKGAATPPFAAQWKPICFNTDYLDYVIAQTKETVANYDADGVFFDIILAWDCCCTKCVSDMVKKNLNPEKQEDRKKFAGLVLENYFKRINDAVHSIKPNLPIFHNSGHIYPEYVKYQSHLELESLPTGGWGYDHFPISAKYCAQLGYQFLGMTGKFHTTWGEFGGFKHPNALKYECAAMIAFGAKCSIGDQFDPSGKLDKGTYHLIGQAYKEVQEKQQWCDNPKSVAEIGLLASNLDTPHHHSDIGSSRILLEGHFLFDVIDKNSDFSKYKLLILPDDYKLNSQTKTKLDAYLSKGGKLFLTGKSGFDENGKFLFDAGAEFYGESEFAPDYILPEKPYCPDFILTPMVIYMKSQRIKAKQGTSIGKVYDPYFNRNYKHFCSHQHAPARKEPSGFDCGVMNDRICYLAHPVFTIYSAYGTVALKDYIVKTIKAFLDKPMLSTNLPSTARVSLMKHDNKYILHLLYANTIKRGGEMDLETAYGGRTKSIEVINELMPIYDIDIELKLDGKVKSAILQPQGKAISFSQEEGKLKLKLDKFLCHQMIEFTVTSQPS